MLMHYHNWSCKHLVNQARGLYPAEFGTFRSKIGKNLNQMTKMDVIRFLQEQDHKQELEEIRECLGDERRTGT